MGNIIYGSLSKGNSFYGELFHKKSYIINEESKDDITYDKSIVTYLNPSNVFGLSKLFILNFKIFDKKIMIYVTDTTQSNQTNQTNQKRINEKSKLVHICHMKYWNNDNNYSKFIQVSPDFKYISLPEYDTLNIYNLVDIVSTNKTSKPIKPISSIDLKFHLDNDNKISSSFIDNNKNITDNKSELFRCILNSQSYTVIYKKDKFIDKIERFDLNNRTLTKLEGLNKTLNRNDIYFSLSNESKYLIIYDKSHIYLNELKISINDILELLDKKITNISFIPSCINYYHNDNNKFITLLDDDLNLYLYDFTKTILHINNNDSNDSKISNEDIRSYLNDYSRYMTSELNQEINNNKTELLTVLTVWSNENVRYWIIRSNNKKYMINGPYIVSYFQQSSSKDMILKTDDMIYNNGYMKIMKNENELTVFNLNKIIPFKITTIIIEELMEEIITMCKDEFKESKYHNNIEIIGADESRYNYKLTEMMRYFLSTISNEKNVFQMRVNANVSVYNEIKSFNIFQDLMSGSITYKDIINNILMINGNTNRYNVMDELMKHIYDYTRIIVLKEDEKGKLKMDKTNYIKSIYIGYNITLLITEYIKQITETIELTNINDIKIVNEQIKELVSEFIFSFMGFEDYINMLFNDICDVCYNKKCHPERNI